MKHLLLRILSSCLLLCLPCAALAAEDLEVLHKEVSEIDMVIDGRLDENVWQDISSIDDFLVIKPDSMAQPAYKTELLFFYTKKGLYVGVYAHQPADTLVGRLSSRDERFNRDGFTLTLDSSGAGLYGNWFAVNLGGSLADGSIRPEREFSREWNGPWRGASAVTDFGWTAEYFLPWSMMVMPKESEGRRRMAFYTSRHVAHLNEQWGYPALPDTQPRFMSVLQGIKLSSVNSGQQFSFQPFTSVGHDRIENKYRARLGADFFWRPSSNLQLSASLAPGFGTVENDDVVVNLGAFETFFSEKRPFFLEGQEIFVTSPRVNQRNDRLVLVNTRRIGAPAPQRTPPTGFADHTPDLFKPVDLYGAAKVTGQTGKLRYGLLTAFEEDSTIRLINTAGTGKDTQRRVNGQTFSAFRLLHEDSSKGGYRALGWIGTAVQDAGYDAYVQGVDAHYLSADGNWKLDAQGLHSNVAGTDGAGATLDMLYIPAQGLRHELSVEWFSKKLELNDLGYVRRNDQLGVVYGFEQQKSALKRLRQLNTWYRVVQNFNHNGHLIRSGFFGGQTLRLKNRQRISWDATFFPERWEDRESLGNGDYKVKNRGWAGLEWESDTSKKVAAELYYNVQAESLGGFGQILGVALDFRPSDRFSLQLELDHRRRSGWLLHSSGREFTTYNSKHWTPAVKAHFFFTARNQFSATLQWVGISASARGHYLVPEQPGHLQRVAQQGNPGARDFTISDLVVQIRYRWEFAPLSELLIVYNRIANADSRPGASFGNLISDAFNQPVIEGLVAQLRYRFGA